MAGKLTPRPWHCDLIAKCFAAGPTYPLAKLARDVGQSEKACSKVLASAWGQAELEKYQAARRQILATKGVRPLEELAQFGHEAARGLVEAMQMAREQESPRELRESAVAILRFLGYEPAKKVEKKVLHAVETISDPAILAKIIEDDEFDFAALPAPETKQ